MSLLVTCVTKSVTDRPTDRRTDTRSYRVASSRLEMQVALNDCIRRIYIFNRWKSTRFLRLSCGLDSIIDIFAKRRTSFYNGLRFIGNPILLFLQSLDPWLIVFHIFLRCLYVECTVAILLLTNKHHILQGSKIFVFHGGHEILFSKTCCSCCFLVI